MFCGHGELGYFPEHLKDAGQLCYPHLARLLKAPVCFSGIHCFYSIKNLPERMLLSAISLSFLFPLDLVLGKPLSPLCSENVLSHWIRHLRSSSVGTRFETNLSGSRGLCQSLFLTYQVFTIALLTLRMYNDGQIRCS